MSAHRRRALIVSPHFPPDTNAASHRVRLLAPHLPAFGWEPTVVTVDPRDLEGRTDRMLERLVPSGLRVVRCRAWSPSWTRRIGIGDLGIRAFRGLDGACRELLRREAFDVLFITTYPLYPALLGPALKRRFHIPFVVDMQDPWVGAWGHSVGRGRGGRPDVKSRVARRMAAWLERTVLPHADAVTAVSAATYEEALARVPGAAGPARAAIPLGGEEQDFDLARRPAGPATTLFDPTDGSRHLCYVGTLLPLGIAPLTALLAAVARLRTERPDLYRRTRLHFVGTSNHTSVDDRRVTQVADQLGVSDIVREHPARVDYLDALAIQTSATAILLLGSTEPHYTASKVFPALLARRPILAAFHERSTVVDVLRAAARPPSVRLITYPQEIDVDSVARAFYAALVPLLERPEYQSADIDADRLAQYSARRLAGRLADVFHTVSARRRAAA